MKIVINKNDIVDKLHSISAHLGNKLSATELVASTSDDATKIDIMLSASLVELMKLLSPYATLSSSGNVAELDLTMPVNWKSDRAANLVALCENYVVHSLFARWLDFIKSDGAALYRTLNNENAVAISHILALREKPQRN
ncbi:MAG: hypothetical protein IJ436_07280 [Bacteroidaceae bacterium]|nr:hypothetical protein [Bacteroidaceae bacterium]